MQTRVQFPTGIQGVINTWTGGQEWLWTANFEAFVAFPARLQPNGATPLATYRFVVDGVQHRGGADEPYHLESNPFTVSPWAGLTATAAKVSASGTLSFAAAATYPRTYESSFRYISDDENPVLCKTCTFRPWAKTAVVQSVVVRVLRATGASFDVPARLVDGRWVLPTRLHPGDVAKILPGRIVDASGATNGSTFTLWS